MSSSYQSRGRLGLTLTSLLLLCLVALYVMRSDEPTEIDMTENYSSVNLIHGFDASYFCLETQKIKPNQFFAEILTDLGLDGSDIHKLVSNTRETFDPRNLIANRDYEILYNKETGAAESMVYPITTTKLLEYDLQALCAQEVDLPLETRIKSHSGVITGSLWQAMTDQGIPYELIDKMEDVYAWSIDFYHLQKGDRFKLIYEERFVDDELVGTGNILAAEFESGGENHVAVRFDTEKYSGFFDLEARPMKKAFLKAPVKFSRISSRYNPRRFHPVLRRTKAHLGTDYAAPTGTPIYAVANGTVTKASFTRGNGNYVKIKHDDQIQTQYLHMRNIKKGIKPGVHVKQGDVIGYVGQTGLATGPHVCFRFWKDGRQVDHLRENLPPPEPMDSSDIAQYEVWRDAMKAQLDLVSYETKIVP